MGNIMQSEIDCDERIARFLKGLMSAQEEAKFLSDMESDEQLKQDAIAQARLVKGMAQVDYEFIQALKNTSESNVSSSIRPRMILFRKPMAWLSVAASIVLIIASYKGYDYYDTTRLGMEYATAFPMETLVRGETDSATATELQTLFENVVERKNLSSTTKRLSELWEISNRETYNDYTDYAPYIGWYLAIGYLEDYNKEKATFVLTTLMKQKDSYSKALQDEVSSLLNEI